MKTLRWKRLRWKRLCWKRLCLKSCVWKGCVGKGCVWKGCVEKAVLKGCVGKGFVWKGCVGTGCPVVGKVLLTVWHWPSGAENAWNWRYNRALERRCIIEQRRIMFFRGFVGFWRGRLRRLWDPAEMMRTLWLRFGFVFWIIQFGWSMTRRGFCSS